MDTNRFFSKEEKQMLIPLYRKLLQLSGDTLLPGDCRKLKAHLVACAATEALQRDPHNIDYRVNRIDLFLTLGRKREAEEDLLFLVRKGVPRASLRDFYRRLKE